MTFAISYSTVSLLFSTALTGFVVIWGVKKAIGLLLD